jgi:chemotaxis signal transduction protein
MTAGRKHIDWNKVKDRLQASQLALERALAADPERLEPVFRLRAAQLARRGADEKGAGPVLCILVFSVCLERFALEIGDLAGVLPFTRCTPVPGGPRALLGVTNIDGVIRSVVDLGGLLELPDLGDRPLGYLLRVRHGEFQTVLRVDELDRIRPLAAGDWSALGEGESENSTSYLKGLTRDRVKLLSTEALFAHPLFQARGTRAVSKQS